MADPMDPELERLREAIDRVDDGILELLEQRADLARAVGKLKSASGWSSHVPERERRVLERLKLKAAAGHFPPEAVVPIYREIMSACLRLEAPISVAYLGPGSTFSYLALRRVFGESVQAVPEPSIDDVYEAMENDRVDYAIVPIENSFEGTVNESLQRLMRTKAFVYGESFMAVEHALLGTAPDLTEVTKVFSHPQAFLQCRVWLRTHLAHAELVATASTAAACQLVEGHEDWVAIAPAAAAAETGLGILARNIQDNAGNETRFLVLSGRQMLIPRPTDKTSFILSLSHVSGQLHQVLETLRKEGINILKLESVPDRVTPWRAYFWMDTEGLADEALRQRVFEAMRLHCEDLHHVGTYSRLP